MSIFPLGVVEPCVTINTGSMECLGTCLTAQTKYLASAASTAWPTANLAIFEPFTLTKAITVVQLFSYTGGVASGNIDMAIYSMDGTKLTSDVHAAQGTINVLQAFNITDVQIGPGVFYLTVALDNNTGTLRSLTVVTPILAPWAYGVASMAAAYVLPAVATLAAYTTSYVPVIGLSTRAVL